MIEIAQYTRDIPVSLERMFENALDWEHLPHLHATTFSDGTLLHADGTSWTAKLTLTGMAGASQSVRLSLDEERGVWVSEVIAGLSRGTVITTTATPSAPRQLTVDVRFAVPGRRPWNGLLGRKLVATYRTLYDEDEAMMRDRQAALDARLDAPCAPKMLGDEAAVLAPGFSFAFGRGRFRAAAVEGRLVAFSAICPHMLGPLDAAEVHGGVVSCPWHGYRFDVRTGSCEGRALRLMPAPRLRVDAEGRVWAESLDSDRKRPL